MHSGRMCAVRDKSLLSIPMCGLSFKITTTFVKIQILEEMLNRLRYDIFCFEFLLVGSFETFANKMQM